MGVTCGTEKRDQKKKLKASLYVRREKHEGSAPPIPATRVLIKGGK